VIVLERAEVIPLLGFDQGFALKGPVMKRNKAPWDEPHGAFC
jgi:hypothetical protein